MPARFQMKPALLLGLASCGQPEQDKESLQEAMPRGAAWASGEHAEQVEPPDDEDSLWNPLMALALVPGPTPLFDRLNDDLGNRYLVGEGAAQPDEASKGDAEDLPNIRTMTPGVPDPEELQDPNYDGPVQLPELPKITPDLESAILAATIDPAATSLGIEAIVTVRHTEEGVQVSLDRAMAKGTIATAWDLQQEREVLIDERRERLLASTEELSLAIEATGGEVLRRGEMVPYVIARIPAPAVDELAARDDVIRIDTMSKQGEPLAVADGLAHQHGAQIYQYVANYHTGDGETFLPGDDLEIAIVEPNLEGGQPASFHVAHGAWRETTDTSSFRFANGVPSGIWDCVNLTCTSSTSYDEPASSHATNIAGIIFGDLTSGQVPSVASGDRERSSGFAREARAHFYLFDNANATYTALEDIIALYYEAQVVNNSYKWDFNPACAGDSAVSQMANQVFLSGSAMFAGAGNNPGSSTSCQVRSPGDAIGSFTVGAHMGSGGTTIDVRTAPIFEDPLEGSAWGGNSTQGQNRSIVSITAAGRRSYRIGENGSISTGAAVGKTSFATAVVSATAIDIMDYHISAGSTWIEAPSALYAALLVMGDRFGVNGKHGSVPDHRWGVGRLRARMFGNGGTDAPYYWYHGFTCIGDGETWDYNLSGANMPADVESVKAAAYWYDYRHDGSDGNAPAGEVANVNISLRTSTSLVTFDSDAYDNKAFVYNDNWPSEPVILRFVGVDVENHHDPSCAGGYPNDQIKVYFHLFAEDDDRDDSLTYDLITGEGVYPEGL